MARELGFKLRDTDLSHLVIHALPPYVAIVDPAYWEVTDCIKCDNLCTEARNFGMKGSSRHKDSGTLGRALVHALGRALACIVTTPCIHATASARCPPSLAGTSRKPKQAAGHVRHTNLSGAFSKRRLPNHELFSYFLVCLLRAILRLFAVSLKSLSSKSCFPR